MTVAELLGSAILRIDRITRSLRGEQMDRLEAAVIPEDILKMKEEYATLDDSLQLSVFFINDQWPAIENNRARLGELRCFADGFGRFCSTVTAFDDAVIADEPSAWKLLGEYEASRGCVPPSNMSRASGLARDHDSARSRAFVKICRTTSPARPTKIWKMPSSKVSPEAPREPGTGR